jgi:hypothetical protein
MALGAGRGVLGLSDHQVASALREWRWPLLSQRMTNGGAFTARLTLPPPFGYVAVYGSWGRRTGSVGLREVKV